MAQKQQEEIRTIYSRNLLTRTIELPITAIGKNLSTTIETKIANEIEGKCIKEGYVKPNSIKIINYSSGTVVGDKTTFCVTFECQTHLPVSGMLVNCKSTSITKYGIRAVSADETPTPFELGILRDYFYDNRLFSEIVEKGVGATFVARVLQSRFELMDDHVEIIGEIKRN